MSSTQVVEALAGLAAAVDALHAVAFDRLDDDGVLGVLREVETQRRRLPVIDHALITEMEIRSLATKHRQRGTAGLLGDLLHLDPPVARARVRAAQMLGPRVSVTGQPLPPVQPATATAQATGSIDPAHAVVITRVLGALPHSLDPQVVAEAEHSLAAHATRLRPTELATAGERLIAHLDPDGDLSDDTDRARRRALVIGAQGGDGMSPIHGLLDPTTRALLDAALGALARPSTTGPDNSDSDSGGGVPDPRSPAQRRHDALAALCRTLLATGTLPSNRGLPATVVLTMTITQLEAALNAGASTNRGPVPRNPGPVRPAPNPDGALVRTATGTTLTIPDALRLATDAHWVLGLFDSGGQPLYLSRTTRLATPAQRLALTARDHGCTRPGCDIPAAWCEVHHLTSWQHGGPTNITNLALVCPYDHGLITTENYTVHGEPPFFRTPGLIRSGRRNGACLWRSGGSSRPSTATRRSRW